MAADTVHVFDTWVQGKKGLLHFDVMTTNAVTALQLAKHYLEGLGEGDVPVTLKECQFCHSEPLVMFSAEQQRQKVASSCHCRPPDTLKRGRWWDFWCRERSLFPFKRKMNDQTDHPDADRRIGHVKGRPMVRFDIDIEKVNHLAEP